MNAGAGFGNTTFLTENCYEHHILPMRFLYRSSLSRQA
ncbi:hypothetical protein SynMINOS11_00843 [Synechococcus sp. Minos11]|nr:hypothetical protein SynMINOS11_00843 [Synechococcus sp. Minos11]